MKVNGEDVKGLGEKVEGERKIEKNKRRGGRFRHGRGRGPTGCYRGQGRHELK